MQIPSSFRQMFAIVTVIVCFSTSMFIARAQDQPASPPPSTAQVPVASSLPADVDPGSPLAQVIHLAQSGVDGSIILAYVNGSSVPFNLTPEQIIYLKDLGVPSNVVTAMIQRDQQLGAAATTAVQPVAVAQPTTAAPDATAEQPEPVTQNYFYDTLSPYGGWVNVDGYGLCWQPTVVVYNSSWQPYCDHGHWVNTDSGWYWLSDYSWGATAFHYGRWFRDSRRGWCWWPETTWAPSWVTWRNTPANDYCGWAPLPPRSYYRPGAGIIFNGAVVAAGFDFGLNVNCFTFVPTRNFCDPHPFRYRTPPTQVVQIFNHTTVINNFNANSRDHSPMNVGIAPERITAYTRQPIQRVTLRDSATPVLRGEQLNQNSLFVNRPRITSDTVTTLNRGVRPPVVRENPSRPLVVGGNTPNNNPTFRQNNPTFSSPVITHPPVSQPPVNHNPVGQPVTTSGVSHGQTELHSQVSTPQNPGLPQNHFTPTIPASNPNNNFRYLSPRQQDLQRQSPVAPSNPVRSQTSGSHTVSSGSTYTPSNPSPSQKGH